LRPAASFSQRFRSVKPGSIEAGAAGWYIQLMQIETSFAVPAPLDRAWALLTDVPRIVPCMPGAQLTEMIDAQTFRGTAGVKIGPMALSFAGEAKIEEQDAAARRVRVAARGNDTKGRGGAQAKLAFVLVPDGAGTRVDITTDLQLNGAVAQYGRGVGLIKEIANQLVGQFAANLKTLIDQEPAGEAESGPAGTPAPTPAPVLVAEAPKPISGITLLVAALRAMLARWFARAS
jgi:carbon monoxide dehydrogenase subunit G